MDPRMLAVADRRSDLYRTADELRAARRVPPPTRSAGRIRTAIGSWLIAAGYALIGANGAVNRLTASPR